MSHDEFFKLIHKDHEEAMGMLDQIKKMPDSDYRGREKMFNQLQSELVPHIKAEEKVFYPLLRHHKSSKEDALEALEEHHIAEISMMELDKMSKQEEFWGAKLSVFKELISHHVEEEESKIFKDAKEVISEDKIKEVMQQFQDEKESIKGKTTTAKSKSK
jgi:hemerythrin-like domain-containing protein